MRFLQLFFLSLFLLVFSATGYSQGFLHADGKKIVNGSGENVLLRGIGTGNWMLMEGYMMKTEGVAGTQHEIRARLEDLMGQSKTEDFFNIWLDNHFTKADVDSMKAWGFNSIRVAMHYKWFTLPIEQEPVQGKNTWIFKGFRMIDNLLDWCEANQMYLILDLHGAPGGQGKNADISDYDPSKPSLWESQANKDKTVALWKELASRYRNEPWIGGYDLINETNWTFPERNNMQMRELFIRITNAIREVDKNHIIFIEGNSFANDHADLTPPWDDNLVYSFHKYWSGTGSSDLDWIIQLRDSYNVPLWMGEAGENSNTWYTDFISLCENNNIGWSWWPVKKNSINNILNVPINKEYQDLVSYWKGENTTRPSATQTYNAMVQWAKNHNIKNCTIQYDVIDAMIRQPHTDALIPYKENKTNQEIFFSDFDLGKNGFAYFDTDIAYYGGEWTAWNSGWGLRSDGVDIEECQDKQGTTNGYDVGWTNDGEWMKYTVQSDSTALYKLSVRHASGYSGSKFHIEVNGADVTGELSLPGTGGWQNWQTAAFNNILIPAGKISVKFHINKGGSNLSYFKFSDPKSAESIDFKVVNGRTSSNGYEIQLSLNKNITSANEEISAGDFKIKINNTEIPVLSVRKDSTASTVIILQHDTKLYSDNLIQVSYLGNSVKSGPQPLLAFSSLQIQNNLPLTHAVPGQIQAEDYFFNQGLSLENCTDANGGKNTAHAAPGEYLDYQVNVSRAGTYNLSYRVATEHSDAEIVLLAGDGENFSPIDSFTFSRTGGWQSWQTQSTQVKLPKGYYFLRIQIKKGEHNLNWFEFDLISSNNQLKQQNDLLVYPNPVQHTLYISSKSSAAFQVELMDMSGRTSVYSALNNTLEIDVSNFKKGVYVLRVKNTAQTATQKIIVH